MDMDRQRRVRAVLDTNVLVGAARRHLLLLASLGVYQLVTSQYILDEVQRVMNPARLESQVGAEIQLQAIRRVAELVDDSIIVGAAMIYGCVTPTIIRSWRRR